MRGKMDCYGLSDVGKVLEVNGDQFLIADLIKSMRVHKTSLTLDDQTQLLGQSQGVLLLVADGMGGQGSGKQASSIAVHSLTTYVLNSMHWFFRLRQDSDHDFQDDLRSALEHCQQQVFAASEKVPEREGMGTTLTMAYLIWPRLYVLHVGDSRCYLFRKSRLKRVTRDHTVAQHLVEEGLLEDPESSQWTHVLWNVIGGESDELRPEVYKAELALGDTLLLCTDGLTRHVSDAAIAEMLAAPSSSAETCQRLIDAANAAGGTDNITVIVAHFRDTRGQEARAETAAAEAEAPTEKPSVAEAQLQKVGAEAASVN
jgi:serine/threonine protein phosphatase PrpC